MNVNIQLIKTDDQITVIIDGEIVDVWCMDEHDDSLGIIQQAYLDSMLFGEIE